MFSTAKIAKCCRLNTQSMHDNFLWQIDSLFIFSGGIKVTAIGDNLDSVFKPVFYIYIEGPLKTTGMWSVRRFESLSFQNSIYIRVT